MRPEDVRDLAEGGLLSGRISRFLVDYKTRMRYEIRIPAHEGRFLEAFLKVERGVAFRGDGLATTSRGLGPPPARHPGGAERAQPIRIYPERRRRGPSGENRHGWSAERRASLQAEGYARRLASVRRADVRHADLSRVRLSALHPPLIRADTISNPGRKCRGNEMGCLKS